MPARPQKINFSEMRAMGVRGILVYCADYRHSIRSAAMHGPMTCGRPTSSSGSSARLAAIVARTCGRTHAGRINE
jgi:hypothetical protein